MCVRRSARFHSNRHRRHQLHGLIRLHRIITDHSDIRMNKAIQPTKTSGRAGQIEKWIPGLQALRNYQRAWLPRDLAGTIVDVAFRPTTYIGVLDASLTPEVPMAIRTLDAVDSRDRNKDVIDDVLYKSEDSYVSLRSVYLQRRRALVAGDQSGADALPNIFEN